MCVGGCECVCVCGCVCACACVCRGVMCGFGCVGVHACAELVHVTFMMISMTTMYIQ